MERFYTMLHMAWTLDCTAARSHTQRELVHYGFELSSPTNPIITRFHHPRHSCTPEDFVWGLVSSPDRSPTPRID